MNISTSLYIIAIILTVIFIKDTSKKRLKNKSIEIKYIVFKEKPTLLNQMNKCTEEDTNFLRAILKNDKQKAIDEFHDSIIAKVNLMVLLGINIDEIAKGQKDNFKKIGDLGYLLSSEY